MTIKQSKRPSLLVQLAMLLPLTLSTPCFSEAEVQGSLPKLPVQIQANPESKAVIVETSNGPRTTTLDPKLQHHLDTFIKSRNNPIAAVAVIHIKTGKILALAQGRDPAKWGVSEHSGIHSGFPAASLFKTVVAAASFERADIEAKAAFGLQGGCQYVRPTGVWLMDHLKNKRNSMNMRRAYGQSCNGFFAKIAVNHLGLGIVNEFANKFKWNQPLPVDFHLDPSPIRSPSPINASTHGVGRHAAGFGYVGINAIHAAWMMAAIANNGKSVPMKIFEETNLAGVPVDQILDQHTANNLLGIMDATVKGGTASFAFRRGKHRKLREFVGGKTGTLTGKHPKGLTTWFAGVMPLKEPEIAVAAVVVLEDLWFIKGPHLAAEAFWAYYDQQIKGQNRTLSRQ